MKIIKLYFLIILFLGSISNVYSQEDMDQLIIRANDQASAGDFQGAIDAFTRIMTEYPNSSSIIYAHRGNVKFRMNNFKEAIMDYNKSISMDSSRVQVFFYRALSKIELNDFTSALDDLNHVITMDPGFGDAYVKRGEVKIELNQKQSGCDDIRKALDMGEEKAKISMEKLCK